VTAKQLLEARQLATIVDVLANFPGKTAYQLSIYVPVKQPTPEVQRLTGLLAVSAPLTLVLKLLGQLEDAGRVRSEPAPNGVRWYRQPDACADCGGTLTVADADIGDRRYCRVDAGRRMAAGEPVTYDQDPADGEGPRTETDCRGSGIYDCPCEADGPDGLCACCRRGDENGSCM
jgi:hypothetical protein